MTSALGNAVPGTAKVLIIARSLPAGWHSFQEEPLGPRFQYQGAHPGAPGRAALVTAERAAGRLPCDTLRIPLLHSMPSCAILWLGPSAAAHSSISSRGGTMMRYRFVFLALLLVLVTGCGASQDAVDLAVCQTRMADPTSTPAVVTVIETVAVEATREVPVTRIVEVEVTREVTRLLEVERIVTATPTETSAPTSTSTPTNTPVRPAPTAPPVGTSKSTLLAAMRSTREDIGTYGYLIDQALNSGYIYCREVVDTYARVVNAPVFTSLPADLQPAYGSYRTAVDIVRTDGLDLSALCQDLIDGKRDQPISSFIWTRARTSVNDALDILEPAIRSLE